MNGLYAVKPWYTRRLRRVARARGVGRPWGFVLNELGDDQRVTEIRLEPVGELLALGSPARRAG